MNPELKFDEKGLIPAVVQDFFTKKILMVAYMNEESLEISMKEGRTCFFSRSRNSLWRKGEESGNYQEIKAIRTDCDRDALVIEVVKNGPACHTGEDSCFFNKISGEPDLYELLLDRKKHPKEGSYTTYLFEKGPEKILKKVGEECTEVIIAGTKKDKEEAIYEIADLAYHVLVLMAELGIKPEDIAKELANRRVTSENPGR